MEPVAESSSIPSREGTRDLLAGLFLVAAFALAFFGFGGRTLLSVVMLSAGFALVGGVRLFHHRGRPLNRWAVGAAVALVVWAALGLVPVPHEQLSRLSPRRAAIEAAVPPNLESWPDNLKVQEVSLSSLREGSAPLEDNDADIAHGQVGWAAVTFDSERTRVALLVLGAWLLVLIALSIQLRESLGLRLLGVFAFLTAGGSLYGLWQARQPGKTIYGIELPPFSYHTPYATFWNSNHFSSLCAMLLPLLLATALSKERALWIRAGALLLLVPIGLAVLDAGSRGGLLASGIGVAVLGLCFLASPERRKLGGAIVLVAVLAVSAAFTLFAERLIDESFEETLTSGSNEFRLALYEQELRMIREAPILGHGLGAFTPAYAASSQSLEATIPYHGEGDWLESAVEGGVPFLAFWLVLVTSLLAPALRAVLSGRAPPQLAALVAGLSAVLAHAAVDFHLRESAVAAAAIVMLATAHVWGRCLCTDSKKEAPPRSHIKLAGLCLVVIFFCAGIGKDAVDFDRGTSAALRAKKAALTAKGSDPRPFLDEGILQAQRAVEARPRFGDAWSLLASAESDRARATGRSPASRAKRDEHRLNAIKASVVALRRSPSSLGVAHRAGSILLAVGADEEAQAAAKLALLVSPMSPEANMLQGKVLLRSGQDEEALEYLALAYRATPLSLLTVKARDYARPLLFAAGKEPERLLAAIPEERHRASYLLALARAGLGDELPPYFSLLAEEPPLEFANLQVALLRHAPGPEAAALAEHLLPQVDDLALEVPLADAMLQGGAETRGEELLRDCLTRADCPAHAAVLLVDALRKQERTDELCEVLSSARERWPSEVQLVRRAVLCESQP